MNYLFQKIRRAYLINFKPEYVVAQVEKRKGVCGKHGCCGKSIGGKIVTGIRGCFDKQTGLCKHPDKMPIHCRTYPIDEKDIVEKFKNICNFYWDD